MPCGLVADIWMAWPSSNCRTHFITDVMSTLLDDNIPTIPTMFTWLGIGISEAIQTRPMSRLYSVTSMHNMYDGMIPHYLY